MDMLTEMASQSIAEASVPRDFVWKKDVKGPEGNWEISVVRAKSSVSEGVVYHTVWAKGPVGLFKWKQHKVTEEKAVARAKQVAKEASGGATLDLKDFELMSRIGTLNLGKALGKKPPRKVMTSESLSEEAVGVSLSRRSRDVEDEILAMAQEGGVFGMHGPAGRHVVSLGAPNLEAELRAQAMKAMGGGRGALLEGQSTASLAESAPPDPVSWIMGRDLRDDVFRNRESGYVPSAPVLGNREEHRQKEEIDAIGRKLFGFQYVSEGDGNQLWVAYRDNTDPFALQQKMKELGIALKKAGYKFKAVMNRGYVSALHVLYDMTRIKKARAGHAKYLAAMKAAGAPRMGESVDASVARIVEHVPDLLPGHDALFEGLLPVISEEARGSQDNLKLLLFAELAGRGWIALTELAKGKEFRGIHFAKIQKAAAALVKARADKVEFRMDKREGMMLHRKDSKAKTEDDLGLSEAMADGTVETFIHILVAHLTQWDRAQRDSNPYRLGNLLKAVDDVRKAVGSANLKKDDQAALAKLKKALSDNFLEFPPRRKTLKAIDKFLSDGKPPKYPVSRPLRPVRRKPGSGLPKEPVAVRVARMESTESLDILGGLVGEAKQSARDKVKSFTVYEGWTQPAPGGAEEGNRVWYIRLGKTDAAALKGDAEVQALLKRPFAYQHYAHDAGRAMFKSANVSPY